jgi:competence protein ComEC
VEWRWDGVSFRMLGPADPQAPKDNDRSCVLLVESARARLLLTGDIGAEVEPGIAGAVGPGAAPVLVVPHHGSRTSSSAGFLAALKPSLALVSAGYRSRFGHPHPDVVQRYREQGAELVNTAEAGCLRLRFGAAAAPQWLERCRQHRAAYWRE